MTRSRWQYSLRTLLLVMTIVTVVVALTANQPRLATGLAAAALGIANFVWWFVTSISDLEGPKTTGQIQREQARMSQMAADD